MAGFINFYRDCYNHFPWITVPNTMHLFMFLFTNACFQDSDFMGMKVSRGECAMSLETLSERTGLSKSKIRTAISHLKSTGHIAQRRGSKCSVFAVLCYDDWQGQSHNDDTQNSIDLAQNIAQRRGSKNRDIPMVSETGGRKNRTGNRTESAQEIALYNQGYGKKRISFDLEDTGQ